jgi:hypothetical protein
MQENILSTRVIFQELGHIIHLAMDDDPAILPGRVPYDIGGGEELLGAGRLILRHGLHHHSLAPPALRFNLRGCGRKKTTLR